MFSLLHAKLPSNQSPSHKLLTIELGTIQIPSPEAQATTSPKPFHNLELSTLRVVEPRVADKSVAAAEVKEAGADPSI